MDLLGQSGISFRVVNIESDLSLISRYGVRIPVLSRGDDAVTLDWPFDGDQAREFVGGKRSSSRSLSDLT